MEIRGFDNVVNSLENGVNGPITRSEMKTLLDPLLTCLQHMEQSLQKLHTDADLKGDDRTIQIEHMQVPVLKQVSGGSKHSPTNHHAGGSSDANVSVRDGEVVNASGVTAPLKDEFGKAEGSPRSTTEGQAKLKRSETKAGEGATLTMIQERKVNQELSALQLGSKVSAFEKYGIRCMDGISNRLSTINEPQRQGLLYRITSDNSFQSSCMVVITFNSALVAYTADWQMRHVGAEDPIFLSVLEMGCLVFFLIELILRLGTHRCYFFVNSDFHWNTFDFILVSISVVDLVASKVVGADSGSNIGFMRLLRLLKLARIFRSLRSFRFFKSLATLLDSFQKSLIALFWSFVMIAFVLYLFALIFMQGLLECVENDDLDPRDASKIKEHFGSLGGTILTLYMSITGGNDWAMYYDTVTCAGSLYGLAFIMFTFVMYFALFNILTGSLVEKAMSSSKPDRADRILSTRRQQQEQRKQFLEVVQAMDRNHDGRISWHEFNACMSNSALLAYMASIGIEVHDVQLFFNTVAKKRQDANGKVEQYVIIEDFVEGCMHMKGNATAIDMQRQLFEVHQLSEQLADFQSSTNAWFEQIEYRMNEKFKSSERRADSLTTGFTPSPVAPFIDGVSLI